MFNCLRSQSTALILESDSDLPSRLLQSSIRVLKACPLIVCYKVFDVHSLVLVNETLANTAVYAEIRYLQSNIGKLKDFNDAIRISIEKYEKKYHFSFLHNRHR